MYYWKKTFKFLVKHTLHTCAMGSFINFLRKFKPLTFHKVSWTWISFTFVSPQVKPGFNVGFHHAGIRNSSLLPQDSSYPYIVHSDQAFLAGLLPHFRDGVHPCRVKSTETRFRPRILRIFLKWHVVLAIRISDDVWFTL